ncbi:MAG: hypothetical protein JWQ81_983 [Amycolatopsis sp.]|nr:hypothetical protein [Amycolatopsis sp.]
MTLPRLHRTCASGTTVARNLGHRRRVRSVFSRSLGCRNKASGSSSAPQSPWRRAGIFNPHEGEAMDLLPTSDQLGDFARLLGDELRTVRKNRCWTRKQLRAQMNPDDELSLKTLATYELGTRRMTVERLLEVCAALDEPPDELLRRAKERAFVDPGHGHIDVNLEALARTENPQLAQFRRWAAVRASQGPQGSQAIERLDSRALVALANLASISLQQLVGALRELRSAAG